MDARAKWLRKLAREAQRQKLARARAAVQQASRDRRSASKRARAACTSARQRAKAWITRARLQLREEIERMRLELRARITARRAAVKACCGHDRAAVRAQADAHVEAARAALQQLRDEHRRERTWSKPDSRTTPATGRQRRAESDHEVEVNLSPDELMVWQRVKGKIHATPRMTRTEAFAHWMHDHSADVAEILADEAERAYRAAVKAEKRERAELRGALKSPTKMRDMIHAELDAVPF